MGLKDQLLRNHREELVRAAQDSPFVVFLCGPTLNVVSAKISVLHRLLSWRTTPAQKSKPSARLRVELKKRLEAEGFEVVLGEDEGLEEAQLRVGINAQDNELEFIRSYCNAVIVIADSVGAFCELGLFS